MESFFDCKPLGSADINTYFAKIKTKGAGSFGKVYTARVTPEGKASIGTDLPDIVAVKAVKITGLSPEEVDILRNEISVLKALRVPHGITYYGCFQNSLYLYLIMELIDGQELYDCIVNDILSADEKLVIVREIALGIKEFHDAGLIHRDIKPENIMIVRQPTLRVVIIDYGFVCNIGKPQDGCTRDMGSPGYHDGLALKGNFDSMKLGDWWALGQIMSIMIANVILYNERTEKYANLTERALYIANVPHLLHDIILGLTRTDIPQERRPTEAAIIGALVAVTDKIKL